MTMIWAIVTARLIALASYISLKFSYQGHCQVYLLIILHVTLIPPLLFVSLVFFDTYFGFHLTYVNPHNTP